MSAPETTADPTKKQQPAEGMPGWAIGVTVAGVLVGIVAAVVIARFALRGKGRQGTRYMVRDDSVMLLH